MLNFQFRDYITNCVYFQYFFNYFFLASLQHFSFFFSYLLLDSSCSSVAKYREKKCLVCQAYMRHMGRAYWGHSHNFHPTGIVSEDRSARVRTDGCPGMISVTCSYLLPAYCACACCVGQLMQIVHMNAVR